MSDEFIVPDAVFPADNMYGIPTLDITKQGKFFELPIRGWGSIARKDRMRGTWHFYVDDEKFSALWKHPDTLLKTKCVAACEANFSTDDQMPYAIAIYRTYQKRWLSRYWQEYDLPMFVDLNVSREFSELNLLGVPKGWGSYSTSATDYDLIMLQRHAEVGMKHAAGNPFKFLVYGGGSKVHAMCEANNWLHVKDARHAAADEKKEQQNG